MGYIYCITNLINGKQYVGKLQVLQKKDLKNIAETPEKKDAMNKYGIENFKIEELEQVDDPTLLSDRENTGLKS